MCITNNLIRAKGIIFETVIALLVISVLIGCKSDHFADPLTPQERQWLTQHDREIVLAVETNYAPFAFIDKNGISKGIANEYIELIEKKLNFRFKRVRVESLNEILKMVQQKKIDVVNAVTQTPSRSEYLLFTKPFVEIPNVIIVRKEQKVPIKIDKIEDLKISLVKDYAVTEYLGDKYKSLDVYFVPDDLTALLNVSFGKTDAAVVDLATASHFVEQKGITNLRIGGTTNYDIKLAIASRRDWPRLNQILEKGLSSIGDKEREAIKRKWISFGETALLKSGKFWIVVITAFSIVLLITIGAFVWNRALRRLVEQKTQQLQNELVERKKAEEELRETEGRYRAFFKKGPDGVVVLETDTFQPIEFNDQICRQLGYTRQEFSHLRLNDIEVQETEEETRVHIQKVIEVGYDDFETLQRTKQGEIRNVHVTAQVIDIGGRNVYHCIWRDITDSKKAEAALRESEKRFRDLAEMLPEAVFEADMDLNLTFVNQRALSLFGYSRQDFDNGLNGFDMLATENRKSALDKIKRRFQGEKLPASEYEGLRKDGSAFPILLHAIPIMQDEIIKGVRGVIVDISEIKRLEFQLQQAHKMEAIGTLAGGVAHEFNNILGIILGNAELALDDVPDWNRASQSLNEILKACLRAKEVVLQILSFARKTMTALKPLNMNTIVKESLKLMRASIPTMVDIQSSIPSESLMILGDTTELHQIVINLCTNASYAMRETGGILEVALSREYLDDHNIDLYENLDHGRFVKLTVRDTGEGISPGVLGKVFEPYFTTKEFGAGSGMGLAVVYGIVKKFKGAIRITSTVGEGTNVEILFPEIDAEFPAAKTDEIEIPKGKERLLLVDDEESIVKTIEQMLERMGYRVVSVTDSSEALRLFRCTPDDFDLVITDMAMPNMSGDQLASELKKVREDISILLCTGHSDIIDENKARQLGIRGFAMKPLDKRKLAMAVRAALDAQ